MRVVDEGIGIPAEEQRADLHEVLPWRIHDTRSFDDRDRAGPLHRPRPRLGDGRTDVGRLTRGRGVELRFRAAARAVTQRVSGQGDGRMSDGVLVIDDEAPIRLLCRVNLEAEGMDVLEAADGDQGLELARAEQPDVDSARRDDAGARAAGGSPRSCSATRSTSSIPIIFLTARAEFTRPGARTRPRRRRLRDEAVQPGRAGAARRRTSYAGSSAASATTCGARSSPRCASCSERE